MSNDHKWFSWFPMEATFETFATEEEARRSAEQWLQDCRPQADQDEWPDSPHLLGICWGRIHESVAETARQLPRDSEGVDYGLLSTDDAS